MKILNMSQPKQFLIQRTIALAVFCLLLIEKGQTQTIINWTFNNTLVPSVTAGNYLSGASASLGSSIPTPNFNSGTEFFGENGWPSGGLDPNAYLQFSVTPNAGYYLVLNSLILTIRHSSLGTSAGSGPASWSLRSSLDGYTSDLGGTSTLSTSYQNFTINLPAAYQGITSTVTFRLYGYNQTTTSGGLNRFVYDNISMQGQTISGVLAAQSLDLTANIATGANAATGVINLQWKGEGFQPGTEFILERSTDGINFSVIHQQKDTSSSQYTDAVPAAAKLFYYVLAQQVDGTSLRSPIVTVTPAGAAATGSVIRGIVPQGASLKVLLHTGTAGSYQVSIWSQDGKALHQQMVSEPSGDATADIAFGNYPHGIYVLTLSKEGVNSSRLFVY